MSHLDDIEAGVEPEEEIEENYDIPDVEPTDADLAAIESENPLLNSSETVADDSDELEEDSDGEDEGLYTLTVDGEEIEVTLEELQRGYATAKSSNQKFQDAAFARKQSEQFISLLKTDPWAVLNNPDLGLDTRAMAENYLADQLRYEQLSDEERELQENRQKLAQYEEQRREQEQTDYDRQMTELTATYHEQYTNDIESALEADGLPVTESTVRRMASYMSEAMGSDDAGVQSLTAADITSLVREDYQQDFKSMFGSADAELLQAVLGDDLVKNLRKADVQKLTQRDNRVTKPVQAKKGSNKTKDKSFNQTQFDEYLDSL